MDLNKKAVKMFDLYAKKYEEKFMDYDLYNKTFDAFCEAIELQHADVLELACGPGNITKYIVAKRPDLNILATDLSDEMLKLARKNIPEVQFESLDCRKIKSLNKNFDAILAGFCLPYLSKEEAIDMIFDSSDILNENGILYLSTMEDKYKENGSQISSSDEKSMMSIHYHEAAYIFKALNDCGFSMLHQDRIINPLESNTKSVDLVIVAKKM